jgi:hypothetical protein
MYLVWFKIWTGSRSEGGLLWDDVKNRARICKPFKEPWNRVSAWRAGTTTLFVVPARQAT